MTAGDCQGCDGTGQIRIWSVLDLAGFIQECPDCDGSGEHNPHH